MRTEYFECGKRVVVQRVNKLQVLYSVLYLKLYYILYCNFNRIDSTRIYGLLYRVVKYCMSTMFLKLFLVLSFDGVAE